MLLLVIEAATAPPPEAKEALLTHPPLLSVFKAAVWLAVGSW
jgi:hypothetical protein